nr:immunoglobulin heavy chain junction region [Mus musculus]MBK4186312.1 immunoglobulin heavy chain junction region [Mus musculus]MBK4186313.1 immunoglobulin heavy chain junction region [Mus musculus]MBK4186314.1 immunoglobulin heavy chain junction region [Mus musculus]
CARRYYGSSFDVW